MNGKMKKLICMNLIGIYFLFSLTGCSTMKNMFGWDLFRDSQKAQEDHAGENVAQFISTLRPSQGNPGSHYLLATYYHERGRHREAIKEFKKVVLISPNYVKAYNGMGVSYDLLGYFSKAVVFYKKALSLNPNLDYVQNNLGYSYLRQGNFDAAIEAFQKAIDLDNQNKRFHNNLGLAYAKKGQFDLALTEFKLAGDEYRAHFNIAKIYYKKGFYNEAKIHFRKTLEINPSYSIAENWLELAEAKAEIRHTSAEKETSIELSGSDNSIESEPERQNYSFEQVDSNPPITIKSVNAENEIRKLDGEKKAELELADSSSQQSVVSVEMPAIEVQQKKEVNQQDFLSGGNIEVSNGNGVNNMARRTGDELIEKGFSVVRLTNADNFDHTKTIIYYQEGYLQTAYRVAQQIPKNQNMKKVTGFDRPDINIKIIIGKDIVPHNKMLAGSYY